MKQSVELSRRDAEPSRKRRDLQRRRHVLLHEQQRTRYDFVGSISLDVGMRLRVSALARLIDEQDMQTLLRARAAEVPLDKIGSKIGDPTPAGARNAIPVDDE